MIPTITSLKYSYKKKSNKYNAEKSKNALSAGGPEFNPQSRTASYQRRYKNGTSSALV